MKTFAKSTHLCVLALGIESLLMGQTVINGSRVMLGSWNASGAAHTLPSKGRADHSAAAHLHTGGGILRDGCRRRTEQVLLHRCQHMDAGECVSAHLNVRQPGHTSEREHLVLLELCTGDPLRDGRHRSAGNGSQRGLVLRRR